MANFGIKEASHGRSAELVLKSATSIPRDYKIKALRDYLIVEPMDTVYSAIIDVILETKPMKGIVKAVGPGVYPKKYNHPDKAKRTKMWESSIFKPTEVKVGDIIELGGYQYGGYSFQTFYWGNTLHLICREEDVVGIYEKKPRLAKV